MKILDFGSVCEDIVYSVDHIVTKGETQDSYSRNVFIGGKGLNQAIALSRAGGYVYFSGKLGKDSGHIVKLMADNGINTDFLEIDENIQTGHAVIQNSSDGNNAIVIYGAANRQITRERVDEVLSHFEKGDVLLLQNEISNIDYIIDRAYEKGMQIVFNPSPYNEKIDLYDMNKISVFLINEIEGSQMSGKDDPEDVISRLMDMYPHAMFILTAGEEGSVFFYEKRIIRQKAYKVNTVDTTAAGDTFTGYFIASYFNGMSVEDSLDIASRASAISVTRKGAAPSIPSLDEVENYNF